MMRTWWSSLLDRFVPATPDVPGQRRARFLGGVLLAVGLASALLLVLNGVRLDLIGTVTNVCLLTLVGTAVLLLRRFGHRIAAAFFVTTSTLLLSVPAWFAGGPQGAGFASLMAVLIAAAILLPPRAVAGLVLYCTGVGIVTLLYPPPAEWAPPGWLHLSLWTVALAITGAVVSGLVRVTEEALTQANERATRLETALADLHATTVSRDYVQGVLERSQAASTAKSNFLANMSHELRTPLNAIIGYTELIEETVEDPVVTQDLEHVHTAAQTLLTLINGVLDLSRVEAGKVDMERTACTVDEIVAPVVALVEPMAHAAGLTLHADVPDGIELHTDRLRLGQVISNLLVNAVKFTPTGSVQLTVTSWERDRLPWIRFVIEDTGIGMTEEQLKTVFEPFVQVGASKDTGLGGTGLGLSICRAYAELLGGQVTATSKLGEGSRFVLELPAGQLTELIETNA